MKKLMFLFSIKRICAAFFLFMLIVAGTAFETIEEQVDDSFSIVLLPDTQYYSLHDQKDFWSPSSDPTFSLSTYTRQTDWIVRNRVGKKIKFVIHLGDITHENTTKEWQVADYAHKKLDDAGISYSVMPGNHDYPNAAHDGVRNTGRFNTIFPPSRFSSSFYFGHFGNTNDNNVTGFTEGNMKFLVISLEFAPTKNALCWADSVIGANPDKRIIVSTHCYSYRNGERATDCGTNYNMIGSCGNVTWNELVRKHSNIFMVVSGHVNGSVVREVQIPNGNKVIELLSDFQQEKKNLFGYNYGNGWMRLLTFKPSQNTITIKTFSVLDQITAFGECCFSTPERTSCPTESCDYRFTAEKTLTYDMTSTLNYTNRPGLPYFNDMTVNVSGGGSQIKPAIAGLPDGNFVVAWEDKNNLDIRLRAFKNGGCQSIKETIIEPGSRSPLDPAVSMNTHGSIAVAWQRIQNQHDIFIASYNQTGRRKVFTNSSDFIRVTTKAGHQTAPDIELADNGSMLVTWHDQSNNSVYLRAYHPDGYALGLSSRVASGRNPKLSKLDDRNYILVYSRKISENVSNIYGTRISTDGDVLHISPSFKINQSGLYNSYPDVTGLQDGGFTACYQNKISSGSLVNNILAATFEYNGTAYSRVREQEVNTNLNGNQARPSIASQGNTFIVTWEDDADGNTYYQIHCTGFNFRTGTRILPVMTVNRDQNGQQKKPAITLATGIVIVWEDDTNGNDKYEIVATGFREDGKFSRDFFNNENADVPLL